MANLHVHVVPWRKWPEYSHSWAALLVDNPVDSLFLSVPWVAAWLEVYGPELNPELALIQQDDGIVGACLLVRRQRSLARTVYLNCDGEDEADSTYIEYNALLAKPDFADAAAGALASHIQSQPWERLFISGAIPQPALRTLTESLGKVETSARPTHYVDLARLRREGRTHRQAISANTRSRINSTRRHLERMHSAEVVLEQAAPGEFQAFLTQLADLHNRTWQARDKPGVFSSLKFERFHRKLVEQLPTGSTLLFRLRAGDTVLALIYCFLHGRRVYFYQSGILFGPDKRLRPGYLGLTMAIERLEQSTEIDEFDFLAGDDQYKRSLATDVRQLHWTTVWSPSLASGALRALKSLRDTIGAKQN